MTTELRVVAVVQARMGSSRLPGKVLERAGGVPLIRLLLDRLARVERLDEILVATSVAPADDVLAEACAGWGIRCVRGSEDDVLGRFRQAAEAARADVVVRITADCPLLDEGEVRRLVGLFCARARRGPEGDDAGGAELDWLSNQAGAARRIPRGHDVEVFSAAALERASREATDPVDREHVTPYLYRVAGRFRTSVSEPPGRDFSHLRVTVDTPEDLEVVRAVVAALGPTVPAREALEWLEAHPEVSAGNAAVRQRTLADEGTLRRRRIADRLLLGRADAGPRIGSGHVARCGALLAAWVEAGGRAVLIGGRAGPRPRRHLESAGVAVHDERIEAEARTARLVGELGAVAVVMDGYHFTAADVAAVRRAAPVVAIDDLAGPLAAAEVVVNQNMDCDRGRYGQARGRLLAGHEYVLLRGEFRTAGRRPADRPRRVVLSMGGADPAGLTAPLARALDRHLSTDVRLDIVAGPALAPAQLAALRDLVAAGTSPEPPDTSATGGTPGGRLRLHVAVQDMAAMLSGACLAVIGAGSTTWETLALGVPPATIAVADNQRPVADAVARRRIGLNLGWHEELAVDHAARAVADLVANEPERAAMARRGARLIDGKGVWRVIDALLDELDRRTTGRAGSTS